MVGNVIVGQSGGPTAVINSSLAGVYKTAKEHGVSKVYGMLNGIQGFIDGRYCDLSEQLRSELDIELLKRTPSSFLGSCRYKLPAPGTDDALYDQIFERLTELGILYFLYIGGNDSMDTIMKLSAYGQKIDSPIRFIGVPKTIDNDLPMTDHTPGFGSTAKYLATVTKEVIRDSLVYNTYSVTFLEIMGRNAGWLTGAAALSAGVDCEGPDLIYLPEVPMDVDDMLERIRTLHKQKRSLVIVVSEGVRTADGTYVCNLGQMTDRPDAFGHAWLTGAAHYLSDLTHDVIGCKSRGIELSTIQRCASHMASLVDVTEAFQAGGAGVKAAISGETGKMVTLKRTGEHPYQCVMELYDVNAVANQEKKVPLEWIDRENINVRPEFLEYVRPLIQGELSPIMVDGLPMHINYSARG